MYQFIKLFLFSLFFFVAINTNASYCYSQSTRADFQLLTDSGAVYLQRTVRDSNGVSYVIQDRIKLEGVNPTNLTEIARQGSQILFSTDDGYYILPINTYRLKEYGITKLYDKDEVTKTKSTNLFLVGGKWYYITMDIFNKYTKQEVKGLLPDLDILANYDRGEMLLKDGKGVYVFYQNKCILKSIPNLDPKQTIFQESDYFYGNHFLYDDDTFYLTSIRFIYNDVTKGFNLLGKKDGFTKGEFHVGKNVSIDTKDGLIWLSAHRTVGGGDTYFYPIEATYLEGNKDMYLYKGNVYMDNWEAINEYAALDLSHIPDYQKLHWVEPSFYSDGKQLFRMDFDSRQFVPVDWLSADMKYYARRGVKPFFVEGGYILKTDENRIQVESKQKIHTELKDFGIAIAYNDRLMIAYTEVQNIANLDKLEFLGSTVNVINPCDDSGTAPVVVYLYYFFKDSNRVYFYNEENKVMEIMEDEAPGYLEVDNYDQLMQLASKLNKYTKLKKKD